MGFSTLLSQPWDTQQPGLLKMNSCACTEAACLYLLVSACLCPSLFIYSPLCVSLSFSVSLFIIWLFSGVPTGFCVWHLWMVSVFYNAIFSLNLLSLLLVCLLFDTGFLCVALAVWELALYMSLLQTQEIDPPASASWAQGLKACATTACHQSILFSQAKFQ